MHDRNETAALIRRLGGPAAVGAVLDVSRQTVHNWIARDRIPREHISPLLRLCVADQLPVKHPQLVDIA